jgi:hypothetical protein
MVRTTITKAKARTTATSRLAGLPSGGLAGVPSSRSAAELDFLLGSSRLSSCGQSQADPTSEEGGCACRYQTTSRS